MGEIPSFERYLDFQSHLIRSSQTRHKQKILPFVTISRETGAGGVSVAGKLAGYLEERQKKTNRSACPWTVFSKNIVEKVIEEHNLPERIIPYLSEKKISEVEDTLDELFGVHPAQRILVRKMSETILQLAELGNVILVGRGSNVITQKLPGGLHIRLIGDFSNRVKHISDVLGMDIKTATAYVKNKDRERKRYLEKYFNLDTRNTLLYDLIVNTDRLPCDQTAALIGEALLLKHEAGARS